MKSFTWLFLFALWISSFAAAQQSSAPSSSDDNAALQQKIRELEDRLIAVEGQLRVMKSAQTPPPAAATQPGTTEAAGAQSTTPTPAAAPAPAESVVATQNPTSLGGAGGSAAKALNPDISMIGDFIASAGGNSVRPTPSFEMHESELGVQSIIDPYARGDFFLTFGEEGVALEEGYITLTSLPASFVVKAGKMRAAFGKVNTMHNHTLPFVDRPLVTQNLVGGEDGIDDAGISIERIIPFPKGIFLSATGQVFRGDSGSGDELVFQSNSKDDVSTVDHLRFYKDLTESTNLELGGSYARGHNELGSDFITSLYGMDATVRWKPLRRAIYHSFVGRSELIWSQREQASFQRAFGMYASAEYQFGRRWFGGVRYDRSDEARNASLLDTGGSVILTYWPSEFSQIRGQYRFTDYAGNHKANEVFMQVLFSLGAHGAHPF